MRNFCWLSTLLILAWTQVARSEPPAADQPTPPGDKAQLAREVLPLLKAHCVKCHGPAKQEGGLNLSTAAALAKGGENGAIVVPANLVDSLLWKRVDSDEMPPDDPLPDEAKQVIQRWIAGGAPGLPKAGENSAGSHWAFTRLSPVKPPEVRNPAAALTMVDRFLLAQLEAQSLKFNPEADRPTLIRRVAVDLLGLPPTPAEVEAFVRDEHPGAYERMVDRYLASPHYGERWGKFWLDAAGYADSNGYFNADSDRPLAYRYRDYVVRALNEDKPFNRFVVEQIAGDELAGFVPGSDATPEIISLLEATHYLRNGQDGSGESDGNADEVRIDRYSALEATSQIIGSSLLGLTLQCAKCHDHKFEPVSQRDYYSLQSVLYPAFNVEKWRKPNERTLYANLPGEVERWETAGKRMDEQIAVLKSEFAAWVREHRPPTTVLFQDAFDASTPLATHWSNTAPGDDTPAGTPPVELDTASVPAARQHNGTLQIAESGSPGDRWLSTKQSFDWTPDKAGQWIQVTFDLVDNKIEGKGAAERMGYFIALQDYNDNGATPHGNILLDGNPAGGASVHTDYPGADARAAGTLGAARYEPGHNYGVRITRLPKNKFLLEHLVDSVPEEQSLKLNDEDLPDGGFGFEYCCGRSFVVDNVRVEQSGEGKAAEASAEELQAKHKVLNASVKKLQAEKGDRPGKIALVTDREEQPPDVFLLTRGNPATPGEKVLPQPLSSLDDGAGLDIKPPFDGAKSTGRRLAWARWLTRPGSPAEALTARVQVNRIWQHHFGAGIVTTAENLGTSGAPPSHPELLDYLASEFIASGWSLKSMHRQLLHTAAYRQTSALDPAAFKVDPDNRLLWRRSLVRLDAEALRDAMLAVGGNLDARFGGPYVATTRDSLGEVLVNPKEPGATRRSLYLQQRRTQVVSLLNVFDSPTIVFNCIQRPASTMPLQSLSLLNSEFVLAQSERFAARVAEEAGAKPEDRIERAFLIALARQPSEAESRSALEFIAGQRRQYADSAKENVQAADKPNEAGSTAAGTSDASDDLRPWNDFCQMLLASNLFLYVE